MKQLVILPLEKQDYILHHLSNVFQHVLIKTILIRPKHIAKIIIALHLLIVNIKHLLVLRSTIVQLHVPHNTMYTFLTVLLYVHQMRNM